MLACGTIRDLSKRDLDKANERFNQTTMETWSASEHPSVIKKEDQNIFNLKLFTQQLKVTFKALLGFGLTKVAKSGTRDTISS